MHLVLDNGSAYIKLGFVDGLRPSLIIANCVAQPRTNPIRHVFGDKKIFALKNAYSLICPMVGGIITDAELQTKIWKHGIDLLLAKTSGKLEEVFLTIVEAYGVSSSMLPHFYKILFEQWRIAGCRFVSSGNMFPYAFATLPQEIIQKSPILLVVDMSHSGVIVYPYFQGALLEDGIYKTIVGGKMMHNEFEKVVNYRCARIQGHDLLLRHVCESCVRVSNKFKDELTELRDAKANYFKANHTHVPDNIEDLVVYNLLRRSTQGNSQAPVSECIVVGPEIISIPELLFNPMTRTSPYLQAPVNQSRSESLFTAEYDTGFCGKPLRDIKPTMGICELIRHSIFSCPGVLQKHLLSNIKLVGGLASLPGVQERVQSELRMMMPTEWEIHATVAPTPIEALWRATKVYTALYSNAPGEMSRNLYISMYKKSSCSAGVVGRGLSVNNIN